MKDKLIELLDLLRWWYRRDSNSAVIVLIVVSESMTIRDLRQSRDLCDSLINLKEFREQSKNAT